MRLEGENTPHELKSLELKEDSNLFNMLINLETIQKKNVNIIFTSTNRYFYNYGTNNLLTDAIFLNVESGTVSWSRVTNAIFFEDYAEMLRKRKFIHVPGMEDFMMGSFADITH